MRKKITTEMFKEMVKNNKKNDGNDFEVLEEYQGTHTKIKFLYKPLDKYFYMDPNHFLSGKRPNFYKSSKRGKIRNGIERNLEWYKNKVYELTKGEYTVEADKYINYNTPILMRHNSEICNHRLFLMSPNQFIGSKNRKGHRCEVCSKHKPTEDSQLKELQLKFKNTEFEILKVSFNENKVWIKHKKDSCNNIFTRNRKEMLKIDYPDLFLCPHCNSRSLANMYTLNYLKERNINFIPEASIKGLKCQRFDFKIYITEKDFFLLELDGIQHREMIPFFDSKKEFKHRQELDERKNRFTAENNISLYRINLPKKVTKTFLETKLKKELNKILGHYKLL